ncbi:MAG: urease accessory protein [Microbacterium sp.]|nr:MAG: urease accessory protein [Microbacterium sp.]
MAVRRGASRAGVDLAVGALAPRLISRDDARAHIALAAAGMILLGGDHVHLEVDVGEGCVLELEDVGGTIAYRADGRPSAWTMNARIETGGMLLWRGLPFVVTDGADVERRSRVQLARGATALIRETLVLGRHGEPGGRISSSFAAADPDGPVLVERLDLDGPVPEPGVLGDHRVLDTVIALGVRPPVSIGDLELEHPGAIARHLGVETHTSRLDRVWEEWSALLRERAPLSLD